MGRGQRGGGGRRGGGGGAASGRHPQAGAAPPSGEVLRVELRAAPAFYEALQGRECPVPAAEGSSSSEASPMGTSELQMREWNDRGPLIGWFRDGIAADPAAELAFSPKLTKQQRASVHGTATAVGLRGLGTASRGVGAARRVVVLSVERAQRPELDEQQDHKAFWTWRWALDAGLQVSRDEVGEMLLGAGLSLELQALWDKKSAQQKAVQRLCGAVVAGDVAGVAAALDAAPALLSDRAFDVQSGVAPLHLAARESQVPALELLLSRGADTETLDGHGWTALQVARKFEQSDAEGALLRAGAHDPDAGKSPLDARLPAVGDAKPEALAPAVPPAAPAAATASAPVVPNGPAAAPATAASGVSVLSDAGSQDVCIDSVASVCGTERDNLAAEVGSNASDYADSQYQQQAFAPSLTVEEEEDEGEDTAAAAESERAQAEAVELAAKAAAEAEAAEAEAEQAGAAAKEEEAEEEEEEEEEEEGEVEAAVAAASVGALNAFNTAFKAAEAAEAAAVEADGMPGEEAAARAAAFRRESEAAVQAAAAAAVMAGDALEEALSGHLDMPPAEAPHLEQPAEPSVASVWSSDAPAHLSEGPSEAAPGGLAAAGAAPAAAADPAAAATEAAPVAQPASPGEASVRNGPVDLRTLAANAAEQTVASAKGGAAAAGDVASKARAELHAAAPQWGEWLDRRVPQWKQWAQERPGSIIAGAGLTAAALAALLLVSRGGRR
ncbi:hypothetical protein C2E20_2537 [Micractinium conductrix]|uniref:Uncharacterized protein n=1 Tax=Micractinium conductrix TaxID=554055 RepID=A0A2P6VJH7_9CHLO|nr:hypothetical protein C2E20_2537 [Micractinium conductrix]|eukprot:PSC74228.1 hypothetical protein C2E20_2537 [Micractinium conductrix]